MFNLFKKVIFVGLIFFFFLAPNLVSAQLMDVNFFGETESEPELTDPNEFKQSESNLNAEVKLDTGDRSPQLKFETEKEIEAGGLVPKAIPWSPIETVIVQISLFVSGTVVLLVSIAVLIFVWGLVSYLRTEDIDEKKKSIKVIGLGIVVLFVVVSIWGLVNILVFTLDLDTDLRDITTNQVDEGVPYGRVTEVNDIQDLTAIARVLIDTTIPIIVLIAVLIFVSGILRYISAKDDKTRQEAVSVIIYGIVSLFVMVSVWGLVNMIADTFNINITNETRLEDNKQKVQDLLPASYYKNR